ncbi:MAG: hypothetical protein KKA60_15100 [Proteobacteria bacterium]|nr:hypothetical protein [Pseudomonadota bacterium]
MEEPRYNVYFSGELLTGRTPEDVGPALARLLDMVEEDTDLLFSGEPVMVATDLDKEKAMALRLAFMRAGALCVVEKQPGTGESETPPPPPSGIQRTVTCPHCNKPQPPARECHYCGQRMKKPQG